MTQGGDRHVAAYPRRARSLQLRSQGAAAQDPGLLGHRRRQPRPGRCRTGRRARQAQNPPALTLAAAQNAADGGEGSFGEWLQDRKNRRQIPHRFEQCGYTPVRNDAAPTDGLWKIKGKRQAIYASALLSRRDQSAAAGELAAGKRWDGKQWSR